MKLSIKITVFTLLVALMLASICPAVLAVSDDTLVITSEEVTVERGDSVDVALVVTQNPGFAGLRIHVAATDGFEVTKVTNGTVKNTMTADYYILWDDTKNTAKTGTLVTLTFKISEDAPLGKNNIDVVLADCCDDALDDVDVTIAPIVINVQEKTAEENSTSPVESDSATESEGESQTEPENTADSLVIDIAEVSTERGDTIKVVLNIVENPGFAALLITVPEIKGFELQEVTNGTIIDTMTLGLNILWDDISDSTETGTLVTLTYKVSDSAPAGENRADIIVRFCNNVDLEEVSVIVDPIVINVSADSSQANNGCRGGCSGEIGFGAMIITTLLAGAFFFRKKR